MHIKLSRGQEFAQVSPSWLALVLELTEGTEWTLPEISGTSRRAWVSPSLVQLAFRKPLMSTSTLVLCYISWAGNLCPDLISNQVVLEMTPSLWLPSKPHANGGNKTDMICKFTSWVNKRLGCLVSWLHAFWSRLIRIHSDLKNIITTMISMLVFFH